jgi:hypothetical protein
MKSRAVRTLAVRRVTQDNRGRRTAGIDGVKAVDPLSRLLFVERLRTPAAITAQPVRRVLIPKAGKPHEFRPLGIPVCSIEHTRPWPVSNCISGWTRRPVQATTVDQRTRSLPCALRCCAGCRIRA